MEGARSLVADIFHNFRDVCLALAICTKVDSNPLLLMLAPTLGEKLDEDRTIRTWTTVARLCAFVPKMKHKFEHEWIPKAAELARVIHKDNLDAAIFGSRLCLACAQSFKGTLAWADAVFTRGFVLQAAGEFDEALKRLRAARKFYINRNMLENAAQCDLRMAHLWLELDEPLHARDATVSARVLLDLESIPGYLQPEEHPGGEPDPDESRKVLRLLTDTIFYLDESGAAYDCHALVDLFGSCGWKHGGAPEIGLLMANEIRDIFKEQSFSVTNRMGIIASVGFLMEMGLNEKALEVLDQMEFPSDGRWESKLAYCHALGKALWRLGRSEEARKSFVEAMDIAEQRREVLNDQDIRSSLLGAVSDIYHDAISLNLELGKFEQALEGLERLKSRNLYEALVGRNSGLEGQEEQIRFDDMKSLLTNSSEALIELYPSEEDTVVFILKRDHDLKDNVVRINDFSISVLLKYVRQLGRARGVRETKELLETVLGHLSSTVWAQIKPYLNGIEKLVFIPYSGFHILPLHAMFSESNNGRQYLIEKHQVSYAPSARVLRLCLGRPEPKTGKSFVGLGRGENGPPLPYAQWEAALIGSFLGVPPACEASRETILHGGKAAEIFHFSGHADGEALWLYGNTDFNSEDRYHFSEIWSSLDLTGCRLATLSCCKTGHVRLGKTDEYVGLPSAFLHAGAANVVCSLWPVPDLPTALLMGKMYDLMMEPLDPPQALRQAQDWLRISPLEDRLEMLHRMQSVDGSPSAILVRRPIDWTRILPEDLSHPYYWAGFICSGAP